MRHWPGRNSLMHIFVLLVAFIYFIKRESEIYKCSDFIYFSVQTYTSLVITGGEIPDALYLHLDSFRKYVDRYLFSNQPYGAADYLTLKFAIQSYSAVFYNTTQLYSPHIHILNILQRQSIWHQSSEDSTLPSSC